MKKLFNTLSTYLKMVRGYSISREEIGDQLLFILLEPKEKKPVSQILKDVLYIYHISLQQIFRQTRLTYRNIEIGDNSKSVYEKTLKEAKRGIEGNKSEIERFRAISQIISKYPEFLEEKRWFKVEITTNKNKRPFKMRFEIDMLIEHYVKKGSALYHIESNTITPVNRLHFDLRQIFRISSVFTTGTPHINIFVNRERLYDLITSLNNVFFYVWEPKDETEKAEMKRDFKTYLKRGQSGYDEVAALLKLYHKKPQEVKRLLDMLTEIGVFMNIVDYDMYKKLVILENILKT